MQWLQLMLGLMAISQLCTSTMAEHSVMNVLEAEGFVLYSNLLRAVRADHEFGDPHLTATVFAPTDKAIQTFLDSMGLTKEEALQRPFLLRAMFSYHGIPEHKLTSKQIQGSMKVPTASLEPVVLLKSSQGAITITDVQGNTANVVQPDLPAGAAVVHGIDRVLLNGRVFTDFPSALKIHKEWSTFLSAADKAGLAHTLTHPSAALTVFLPSHKAFSSKHRLVDGSAKALGSLLRYHAVAGAKELPGGFKQLVGQDTLLPGHHITMKMETFLLTSAASGSRERFIKSIMMVPEQGSAGRAVQVVLPNIFIGKSVVHGIDALLLPAGHDVAGLTSGVTSHRKLLGSSSRYGYGNGYGYGYDNNLQYEQDRARRTTARAIEAAAEGRIHPSTATRVGTVTAASVGSGCGGYYGYGNGCDNYCGYNGNCGYYRNGRYYSG